MRSKFGLFVIGTDFSKAFSNYMADKTMIKWELIPIKNPNNQLSLVFEYTEDKPKVIDKLLE